MMSSSYDGNLTSTRDKVRFMIGDTQAPWAVTNEEIDAVLEEKADQPHPAAITICRRLIAKYTRLSSGATVGPFSVDYRGLKDSFKELLAVLEQDRSETSAIAPYVSGFDKAGKQLQAEDDTTEPAHARVGIHDTDLDVDYSRGDYVR
jgi:hypothetical protein